MFYDGEDKQVDVIYLAYSSSLRAPLSSGLRVWLTVNTKEFFGKFRCQVVSVMYAISWVAPFPSEFRYAVQSAYWILTVYRLKVLIATWVVYFSAVSIADTSTRVWRQVNVAELNEP